MLKYLQIHDIYKYDESTDFTGFILILFNSNDTNKIEKIYIIFKLIS